MGERTGVLATMQDALEAEGIDPYLIAEGHPPYELRARVLAHLADDLEWTAESRRLKTIVASWHTELAGPENYVTHG